MPDIIEGSLRFSFSANAMIRKYDETAFYRNQFIKITDSVKAVDFVCVEDETLWLIEVKDYRNRERDKAIALIDEIAQKIRDTLAGLVAAKFNANNAEEKQLAQRALNARVMHIVLHIEEDEAPRLTPQKSLKAGLKQKMKQRLKSIDAHPHVIDQHTLHAHMNWTVSG